MVTEISEILPVRGRRALRTTWLHPVILALAAALVAGGCERKPAALCKGCNVVLITIDALRADHLGTYGYVRATSPAIDRLANQSVVFEQAVVAWPKTTPGLASIMSGQYAHTIRMMYGTWDPLLEKTTTLSEILKGADYATSGIVTNGNLSIAQGWKQGFDEYTEMWHRGGGWPGVVTERGLAFARAHTGKPFFLWLHYIDPHSPYAAGEPKFRFRFVDDQFADQLLYDPEKSRRRPIDPKTATWRNEGIKSIPASVAEDGREDVTFYIAEYDAEIAYTDHYVGEFLDGLKAAGLADRTVVVLAADHGEALGDHNWYFDHGRFAYDDVSRIPLLVHVPGVAPRRVAPPVSSIDVAPTILDAVGVPSPVPMEGRSLVPVLDGKTDRVRDHVFNEAGYNREPQTTVRDGRWKLIYVPSKEARSVMQGGLFELYDIEADPLETRNLADTHPEEVARLKPVLFAWMRKARPPLNAYEMIRGQSEMYLADYDYPTVAAEGLRFYAKIPAGTRDMDYCFALPTPDPDATVVIEMAEANAAGSPYRMSKTKWDDPLLTQPCVGDPWGCVAVNGEPIQEIPYRVRLGDLGDRTDPHRASLHGQGNDKTFCFHTGPFNKRLVKSDLGYVVEVMGTVEPGPAAAANLDPETRENLRSLGYVQ
jgi:arylsulfatase A-like enzyme